MDGGQKDIMAKNGWAIGTHATYESYEAQDTADSESIYDILEKEIIPIYYNLKQKWFFR